MDNGAPKESLSRIDADYIQWRLLGRSNHRCGDLFNAWKGQGRQCRLGKVWFGRPGNSFSCCRLISMLCSESFRRKRWQKRAGDEPKHHQYEEWRDSTSPFISLPWNHFSWSRSPDSMLSWVVFLRGVLFCLTSLARKIEIFLEKKDFLPLRRRAIGSPFPENERSSVSGHLSTSARVLLCVLLLRVDPSVLRSTTLLWKWQCREREWRMRRSCKKECIKTAVINVINNKTEVLLYCYCIPDHHHLVVTQK